MLARMLEDLGVFMGCSFDILPDGEDTREATFVTSINAWIMEICGGPPGIPELYGNPQKRKLIADYLRLILSSPNVEAYLGGELYKSHHSLFEMDIPWGWKDPTATYTVTLWRDLYPDAKVIHIYRNGVAIANSLKNLQPFAFRNFRKWIDDMAANPNGKPVDFPPRRMLTQFLNIPENFPPARWIALWEIMTKAADLQMLHVPEKNRMEIRYETFITECAPGLEALCRFLDIPADRERIEEISGRVKPERAEAYKSNPEYAKLYEAFKNSPQMIKYRY